MTKQGVCLVAAAMLVTAATAFAQGDKPAPKPVTKSAVADKLMAQENKLIEAVKANDAKTFGTLVMKGAWSLDDNGYMPVDDFIKMMGDPKSGMKIEMLRAKDMRVIDIDAGSAIVTYTAEQKGTFMGQPLPTMTYATTIWHSQGGTWHAVFHQETPAPAKK